MLHVAPDLSGVIPLNAFEAQAASVRDLAAGVMDVSGVAGTALPANGRRPVTGCIVLNRT